MKIKQRHFLVNFFIIYLFIFLAHPVVPVYPQKREVKPVSRRGMPPSYYGNRISEYRSDRSTRSKKVSAYRMPDNRSKKVSEYRAKWNDSE